MIDPTVKKETRLIALWTALLTLLMEAVFLILGKWDWTVLFGGLLGACAAVLNFFLMGLGIQKALGQEAKDAKNLIRLSQSLRLLMLGLVVVLAFVVQVFNPVATVIPLFFPRVAILFRPLYDPEFKKGTGNEPSLLEDENGTGSKNSTNTEDSK